jgi:hypothetical protein
MMRAYKLLTVGVGTLVLGLVAAPSAEAGLPTNGVSLNGISINGLGLNGMAINGLGLNGLYTNGMAVNGVTPATPAQAEPPVLKVLSVTLPTTQDR